MKKEPKKGTIFLRTIHIQHSINNSFEPLRAQLKITLAVEGSLHPETQ